MVNIHKRKCQVSVNWLSSDTSASPDPHCSWPAREATSVKLNQQKHWLKTDPKTLNSSSRCRDNKTSSAKRCWHEKKRKKKPLVEGGPSGLPRFANRNIPTMFSSLATSRPNKTTPVQLMLRNGSEGISTSIKSQFASYHMAAPQAVTLTTICKQCFKSPCVMP